MKLSAVAVNLPLPHRDSIAFRIPKTREGEFLVPRTNRACHNRQLSQSGLTFDHSLKRDSLS